MLSSLRARLTLSHLALIVLAMGVSGFLLLSFLERYFLEAMEQSLLAQARITAQALIPGAMEESLLEQERITTEAPVPDATAYVNEEDVQLAPAYNALQQQVQSNLYLNYASPPASSSPNEIDWNLLADVSLQLSAQLETRIRILDSRGVVVVDSRQDDQGSQGMDMSMDSSVQRALEGNDASRIDEVDGNAVMHLALPALTEDQLVGVVYLSQPLRDVTAVLHDLRGRWLLSTAIALVLSGGVGLLLARAIANPLRRLTTAAGAVAQGQFDQQVPVRSQDEIGRLSRAFNDMTARLRAARQMQVDFVADVSHELRTPLTSVKSTVETLRDGAVDDPEVRDRFLATVESETDRLIRLVNDLLVLSRADSEALNLQLEPVDLAELAQATVGRLASQAEARRVALKIRAASIAPPAQVDADRIEQVLVNLLDNAIKYSRPGEPVTVTVGVGDGGTVQVQVRDKGIGIPTDDLSRVGQRFYRADKARSRAEGGSGLGLAIAQALVEAHGGELRLDSEEGKGTVVTFTLPAA